MPFDVFISYSSRNKHVADAAKQFLQNKGIRCWKAPDDIAHGDSWARAIPEAIRQSRIMVLIWTRESMKSSQVINELTIADRAQKLVIPFRAENIEPENEFEYYLAKTHWLDVFSYETQKGLELLADRITLHLGTEAKIDSTARHYTGDQLLEQNASLNLSLGEGGARLESRVEEDDEGPEPVAANQINNWFTSRDLKERVSRISFYSPLTEAETIGEKIDEFLAKPLDFLATDYDAALEIPVSMGAENNILLLFSLTRLVVIERGQDPVLLRPSDLSVTLEYLEGDKWRFCICDMSFPISMYRIEQEYNLQGVAWALDLWGEISRAKSAFLQCKLTEGRTALRACADKIDEADIFDHPAYYVKTLLMVDGYLSHHGAIHMLRESGICDDDDLFQDTLYCSGCDLSDRDGLLRLCSDLHSEDQLGARTLEELRSVVNKASIGNHDGFSLSELRIESIYRAGGIREAADLYHKLLVHRSAAFDRDSDLLAKTMSELALTMLKASRVTEAQEWARRALNHRIQNEGEDSFVANVERLRLAKTLLVAGRKQESLEILKRLASSCASVLAEYPGRSLRAQAKELLANAASSDTFSA